jgi:parallel beta-helix repeat protein
MSSSRSSMYKLFQLNHESLLFRLNIAIFFLVPIPLLDVSGACSSYSSSSKTITVSCATLTHLRDVSTQLNIPSILKQESQGVWVLAANLVVAKGANLVIDSTDGTWLKIISDGTVGYGLKNSGKLKIDGIKITSWNTATNNYASAGTDGTIPRGYIVALSGGTGTMDILNSEIAYLGYTGTGHHGLDYYGSSGSQIRNNEIHHLWRAFYSSGVSEITIDRNTVHDNYEYGIDPHSGTHDMTITNNKVYNNNHGIICSVACYNMHIENNEAYNNNGDGIFLDAGSHHSVIANNIVHDNEKGIQLPSLSYSEVYGNKITNSKWGIVMYTQVGSVFDTDGRCVPYGCVSINNNIHNNEIQSSSIGIHLKQGASGNTIEANTINAGTSGSGIIIENSNSKGNIVKDNHITTAKYGIESKSNTDTKVINNRFDAAVPSGGGEYTLSSSSAMKLENTQFASDIIIARDSSSSNTVTISNSGTIKVTDSATGKTTNYNTNSQPYTKTLSNSQKLTVTTETASTDTTDLPQ